MSDVVKMIPVRHGRFFSGRVVIFQLGERTLSIVHPISICKLILVKSERQNIKCRDGDFAVKLIHA